MGNINMKEEMAVVKIMGRLSGINVKYLNKYIVSNPDINKQYIIWFENRNEDENNGTWFLLNNEYASVYSMNGSYSFIGLWNLLCSSKLNGSLNPTIIKIQAKFRGIITRKKLRHERFLRELTEEMWKPSRLFRSLQYLPNEELEFYKDIVKF